MYAKCLSISFPAHELYLITQLDALADMEGLSRSQYIRRWIRKETEKTKELERVSWSSLFGDK